MTFLELYGEALDIELSTADRTQLFTTTRRKKAINDAMTKWITMTKCAKRKGTIAMVTLTYEYDLLSNFSSFIELDGEPSIKIVSSGGVNTRWVEGDNFIRTDTELLDRESPGWREFTSATPTNWYWRVDNGVNWIGMAPGPDITAGDTWTLYVPYISKATEMTVSGDIPFTFSGNVLSNLTVYHQALAHYAASLLEPLRKGYPAAQRQQTLFAGWVAQYLQDQQQEQPAMISLHRNYYKSSIHQRPMDWRREP